MVNRFFLIIAVAGLATVGTSCKMLGKKGKGSTLPNDGQLHGVAPGARWAITKPLGMVYVKPGTFHMGPSDEDVNYSYTSRNRQVSISGFWMDATEITNNEYRQFTNWVRDSIAAKKLNMIKTVAGKEYVDWKKAATIKWGDAATMTRLEEMMIPEGDRLFGVLEIDPNKLVYQSEIFDYQAAASNKNRIKSRKEYIIKQEIPVYPDSLSWVRDFSYAYNEPMAKKYFNHPAYGNYPVVGVNWKQATAFCEWRTNYLNSYLKSKKRASESDFRLPTEAQWEWAARGGRTQAPYPWGGPYIRNQKGCLLANFKPGRGNYAEDGGLYTVRADAYWPNDFGLYNMAGNVAEWTSSLYYEGSDNFMHDLNPDVRYNAKEDDYPRMKRKVVRGGSWKDVAHYCQVSTRSYEYQDTAKCYIGFRTVIDLPVTDAKKRKK